MNLLSLRYCSNKTAAGVARAFPDLIARFPTWEAMADAPLAELQEGDHSIPGAH